MKACKSSCCFAKKKGKLPLEMVAEEFESMGGTGAFTSDTSFGAVGGNDEFKGKGPNKGGCASHVKAEPCRNADCKWDNVINECRNWKSKSRRALRSDRQ